MQRRQFLKSGLVVAGGAAAVAAGCRSSDSAAGTAATAHETAATLALTAEGELVLASTPHGATPRRVGEAARRGVPGKKWVMVIDLAACDGCGKCSEACTKNHYIPADREYLRIFKMQIGRAHV